MTCIHTNEALEVYFLSSIIFLRAFRRSQILFDDQFLRQAFRVVGDSCSASCTLGLPDISCVLRHFPVK